MDGGEWSDSGTSLAVQWLRLHASTAGGTGSIPDGELKKEREGGREGGRKGSDSGNNSILTVEPAGFADGLNMGCEEKGAFRILA